MFSNKEISDFNLETEKILDNHFEKDLVQHLLRTFNFGVALNRDAKILETEIRKFSDHSFSDENMLNCIVKGITVFNYKSELGKFIASQSSIK